MYLCNSDHEQVVGILVVVHGKLTKHASQTSIVGTCTDTCTLQTHMTKASLKWETNHNQNRWETSWIWSGAVSTFYQKRGYYDGINPMSTSPFTGCAIPRIEVTRLKSYHTWQSQASLGGTVYSVNRDCCLVQWERPVVVKSIQEGGCMSFFFQNTVPSCM